MVFRLKENLKSRRGCIEVRATEAALLGSLRAVENPSRSRVLGVGTASRPFVFVFRASGLFAKCSDKYQADQQTSVD